MTQFLDRLKRNKRNLFTAILSALIVAAGITVGLYSNTNVVDVEQAREISVETEKIDTNVMAAPLMVSNEVSVVDNTVPIVDNTVEGSALYIDGVFVGAVKNVTEIQAALAVYRANALEQVDGKNKEAQFVQEVSVQSGLFDKDELISAENILDLLNTVKIVECDYTVQEGDTLEIICAAFDMSEAEFEVLNEKTDFEVGDTVRIWQKQPKLSVKITATKERTEVIPYETVTVYDDTETTDVSYVSQNGQTGLVAYSDEIVYINGVAVSTETVSEKTISAVRNKEITQGTLEYKAGYATGTFLWPVPSTTMVTSEFGYRWGTIHKGIDIAGYNVYGADIVAADGGTVTYAAYDNSGYGMNVYIDHGNGLQTHYAHCSAMYVSEGEQVYAGQVIAAVGSTGDSTGPHLHFEVIVNGEKVDPRNYL